MHTYDYDLIIIGGGSAGLSLASVSARLGVKVALIDAGDLGGDCLHYGCVPSKSLIHSAKIAHLAKNGSRFGVHTENMTVDFKQSLSRVHEVIQTIADHVDNAQRFRDMGCDVWTQTKAKFIDPHTIHVGNKNITGKKIAICAGTRPSLLPLQGLEDTGYLTNETVFYTETLPKSLVIIGSGPIGCELAQAFSRLGTKVTLLNRSDRILGKEDEDVQQEMRGIFQDEGIEIITGIEMKSASANTQHKTIHYSKDNQDTSVSAEQILVAIGRTSNADSIDSLAAGVEIDKRGYIVTNQKLQTTQKHIYAAGDITGHLQFTHSAGYEAGIIVSNAILHIPKKLNLAQIPWATFTDPEVASCGINERSAKSKNIEYSVEKFYFTHQDRALAEGETRGFIKVLLSKKNRILGCQIIGPNAGELIAEWILALNKKMKIGAIAGMTHIYPTLTLANQQIAGAYMGKKFFTPRIRSILRKLFGYRNTKIDSYKGA